jgi:hypothetical protein
MQFSEMVQEVKNIIQDSSFDDSVPGYVNEAFLQASGRINIPDLKRIGVTTTITDQMYVSLAGLPDGFGGRLSKILNNDIQRYRCLEDLMSFILTNERLIDEVGTVEAVALEGKTLWYFPTPAVETDMSCILYSNPKLLEDDEDIPLAFPEQCHRNIGVHGAAFVAYGIIEDGIEGDKVNTNYHFTMFEKGIQTLMEWIGKNRINTISSTFNDDGVVSTVQWGSQFTRWTNVK